jgi:hypothetical protein
MKKYTEEETLVFKANRLAVTKAERLAKKNPLLFGIAPKGRLRALYANNSPAHVETILINQH